MKKKILCLDGGGIKGLFAAQFLAEIERITNSSICSYFDMIAGTSTGAIIAAGLALGIPAHEICKLYVDNATSIFPQRKKVLRTIKRFCSSKYDNDALGACLREVFGERTIGSCKTRLLIPSYNLTTGKVQVFKTAHADDLLIDHNRRIVEVLLSTTAAPTYLPPNKTPTGTYIDGGIGANNPTLIAITEAVSRCNWERDDLYLLNVGCLQTWDRTTTGNEHMSFQDIGKLVNIFMSAEMQYSENIARILLTPERYYRINPSADSSRVSIDKCSPDAMNYLISMAKNEAQNHIYNVRNLFFDVPAEAFAPYHQSIEKI